MLRSLLHRPAPAADPFQAVRDPETLASVERNVRRAFRDDVSGVYVVARNAAGSTLVRQLA